MRRIAGIWRSFNRWLQHGDLVPFLVIVSAWHYIQVLIEYDPWPVAVAVGLLVDLGHYRTVLLAARLPVTARLRTRVIRWAVALALTAVSLSYHYRFYAGDWWLAAPMPVLIGTLAYFERTDRRSERSDTQTAAQPASERRTVRRKPRKAATYTCELCDFTAQSPQAYAGHCRGAAHKAAVADNGRAAAVGVEAALQEVAA